MKDKYTPEYLVEISARKNHSPIVVSAIGMVRTHQGNPIYHIRFPLSEEELDKVILTLGDALKQVKLFKRTNKRILAK